jgi:hypothetical protein
MGQFVLYCIVLSCLVLSCPFLLHLFFRYYLYGVWNEFFSFQSWCLTCISSSEISSSLFIYTLPLTYLHLHIHFFIVLYCIVLYCIVLYCIVLYCIVLYCIVLYCIVLYRCVGTLRGGADDIVKHPWFAKIDFNAYLYRKVKG